MVGQEEIHAKEMIRAIRSKMGLWLPEWPYLERQGIVVKFGYVT
jgi:hypothetical protein